MTGAEFERRLVTLASECGGIASVIEGVADYVSLLRGPDNPPDDRLNEIVQRLYACSNDLGDYLKRNNTTS